jgi:glucose/arabinose dehydrogenase
VRFVNVLLVALTLTVGCGDAPPALAAGPTPEVRLEQVAKGLQQPIWLTHDKTDRIFIVEQEGRVRLMENGTVAKQPYLDIVDRVASGGECGLLGLAFHPDFARNGRLFVNYTHRPERRKLVTRIAEFTADPKSARVDPASERVLLTFDQPYPNHNGGHVEFGPDGMLYIATGDGGAANDPHNAGQRTDTLLAKILRVDVDAKSSELPYGIPMDNPFVGRGGARPEIWCWGLRNPWRFTFDRETGTCYTGDVGQNLYEELDVLVKGGNYGWREREGLHAFEGGRSSSEFIDPIAEYGRDKGQSVTGGVVYRGTQSPALRGIYLYADYASGRFWGLKYENGKVTAGPEELNVTRDGRPVLNRIQPAAFAEDAAGEVYVCDHQGGIYRIVAK